MHRPPLELGATWVMRQTLNSRPIGFIAEFMINNKMGISPDFTFYFPKKNRNIKTSWYEVNGNFNYYFVTEINFHLYGLAGLNVTNARSKNTNNGDVYFSNSELGLNLGFGFNFAAANKVMPFSQIKYVVSDYDHASIIFGVKVRVN